VSKGKFFMRLNFDDDLKELFSEILKAGSVFTTMPLRTLQTDQMKENGTLLEECLPAGFRYRISNDLREYLEKNPQELFVDYSEVSNLSTGIDLGIL